MVLTFPFSGIHKGGLPGTQPENTSPRLFNVRPYWQGRLRGGQRPGLSKWSDTQVGGAIQPIVSMSSIGVVESP
jgi:hypothetical protein